MNTTPLEYDDQCTLVEWMEVKDLKFTAIPNSTWTKSANQKRRNKKSGLRAGFPDLVIIIPQERSKTGKGEVIFLEMKRLRGSTTKKEQKEWYKALSEAGQHVFIAKGVDMAIEILEDFLI